MGGQLITHMSCWRFGTNAADRLHSKFRYTLTGKRTPLVIRSFTLGDYMTLTGSVSILQSTDCWVTIFHSVPLLGTPTLVLKIELPIISVNMVSREAEDRPKTLSAWLRLAIGTFDYSALPLSGIKFAISPLINSARQDWKSAK